MSNPPLRVLLSAGYGKTTVVDQIAFDLQQGERLGLVGTSGAGKSTLVLALLGLLPLRGGWAKGEVLLNGQNLLTMADRVVRSLRGREIALVPQSPLSALNSAVSLRVHFEEAWRAHVRGGRDEMQLRLGNLLEQMQLPGDAAFLARRPGEVSVGQAQRAAIALALLHKPAVLIADEPTSSLDPLNTTEVLGLLRQVSAREGTSVLFISHDLLSVVMLCQRMAVLHERRIVEVLNLEDLVADAEHPESIRLLSTLPAALPAIRRVQAER